MAGIRAVIRAACGRRRHGAAAVEMALVAPVLILLLFGIIEFGVLLSRLIQLNNLTREGARMASVGSTVTEIETHMAQASGSLNADLLTINIDYWDSDTGAWEALAEDGSNASTGAQIRVRAEYPHELVVGTLFATILGSTDGSVPLSSTAVMRKE